MLLSAYPNPATDINMVRYRLETAARVKIVVRDQQGKLVNELLDAKQDAGIHSVDWSTKKLSPGVYFITVTKEGAESKTIKLIKH
jgi:hypothetical protein